MISIQVGSYMEYLDIGEMFLNLFLNAELQKYLGADVTYIKSTGPILKLLERERWINWQCWY